MNAPVAETLLLTTRCSAACAHCPFSRLDLPRLDLDQERLRKAIRNSSSALLVISGGEPFEHPRIETILNELRYSTKAFRIATGGFVPLSPWIGTLKALSAQRHFQGISIGTDVLIGRSALARARENWVTNITLLNEFELPYSITVTLGKDLPEDFVSSLVAFGCLPEFFYIRSTDPSWIANILPQLNSVFPKTPWVPDLLG